jgi:hypothetical protein
MVGAGMAQSGGTVGLTVQNFNGAIIDLYDVQQGCS